MTPQAARPLGPGTRGMGAPARGGAGAAAPRMPTQVVAATVVATGLTAISGAASLVAIPELLPRYVRATGLAIAYAAGVSLFGGTTQFVITYPIGATGDAASPARHVVLTSSVTAFAMWAPPESRGRKLES